MQLPMHAAHALSVRHPVRTILTASFVCSTNYLFAVSYFSTVLSRFIKDARSASPLLSAAAERLLARGEASARCSPKIHRGSNSRRPLRLVCFASVDQHSGCQRFVLLQPELHTAVARS